MEYNSVLLSGYGFATLFIINRRYCGSSGLGHPDVVGLAEWQDRLQSLNWSYWAKKGV